ncbi:hypothetical protein ACOMHN_055329 [Nucella lapillus]
MVPPFLQPHPDLQSAVGNAPLSSKHPTQLPTTDCLLSIIPLMGGQPSDAPALSPPSPLQQGGQSSNAPALSPPSPLPQGGQPIALALLPSSPPPQDGQPSDAPGLSPSSSTLLLCPSDSTLSICHLNSQSAVKTAELTTTWLTWTVIIPSLGISTDLGREKVRPGGSLQFRDTPTRTVPRNKRSLSPKPTLACYFSPADSDVMRRFLLDSVYRQLLTSQRDTLSIRSGLASGSRHFTSKSTPKHTTTSSRLKASRTPAVRPSASSPGLSESSWDNDVTEREVTVCPMASQREKTSISEGTASAGNSNRSSAEELAQAATATQTGLRPPTPGSSTSTTVPPYLDFDSARPFSEMPAPLSLPVIGTMWMHMPGGPLHGMTFEEKTKRMQEMYGSIIREKVLLGFTLVHVFRPEDMEAVYRVEGARPRREAFRMLKKYYTEYGDGVQGVLSSQGEEWYKVRSQTQVKMLKPKSASAYLDLHNTVSEDFVACIDRLRGPDGIIEDLLPELYKFAMEGIGCVCFNRRLGAMETDIPADSDTFRFIRAVSDVMEATHSEINKPFLFRYSRSFRKLVEAQSFIRELSTQEMKRTLASYAETDSQVDGESGDLIPYLMTKTQLTEQQVLTIISECFFAGVDTTSHLLGFVLYLLAKNPGAQDKLIQEIDQLVPGNDVISANTLGRMSYLKGVMKETFRMMPVSPGNGRTLTKDVVLSGYRVPVGIALALHHDWAGKSDQYVKEADRFEPERWKRGNTDPLGDVHPFILMPFGFGPRSCLGRRFAEQEYSLGLIKILQKYHVEYAHSEDMWYEMCVVNKPITPLRFRFVPRK